MHDRDMMGEHGAPKRRVDIQSTGHTVRANVKDLRAGQGLSMPALCQRLNGTGRTFLRSTISEIENGGRRVDVDDLVALAAALRVSPLTLLMPETVAPDVEVETTASPDEPVTAGRLWQWMRTELPLKGDDLRPLENLEFQWRSKPSWSLPELNVNEHGMTAAQMRERAAELIALAETLESHDGNH